MEHLWIGLAVMAALLQAVRTAAQKTLNQSMSTLGTTYVRSVFGLPVMIGYLAIVLWIGGGGWPPASIRFQLYTLLGAVAQVLATALLIRMFRLKNFAVGTMLTKVDIVMTALIGMVLFSERVSSNGFLALLVVLAGVIVMSIGKTGLKAIAAGQNGGFRAALTSEATQVALGCALLFTLSYLFLREATLAIAAYGDAAWRGAWTVVLATAMQVVFLGLWLAAREPATFRAIRPNLALSTFVGLTSAIGSIGWFTAFAMQNASYVRAVGQIEVVFTLLISSLYFREKIRPLEYAGIVLTVAGVLMFRLWGV
jgi:drug/metabolite transporter (DMT)-like permease